MSSDITVLIADDDEDVREDLLDLLKGYGWTLIQSETAKQTWEKVEQQRPNLVLLDLRFPDSTDLSLLKRIKETYPEIEVIMVTGEVDNVDLIVSAIKFGAYDYVPKPFVGEELKNRIQKALSLQKFATTQEHLLKELEDRAGMDLIIGNSPAMQHVVSMIRQLATVDGSVLVLGESGTGKELVARAIHYLSKRRSSPFVPINCAGIPSSLFDSVMFGHKRGAFTGAIETTKGRFATAGDGTIFLDEIGDMPLDQQSSLLRVLDYRKFTPLGESVERETRARFIFATNRDLRERVREGEFRQDLFFRINVAPVLLPPLKARIEDIPGLVEHHVLRLASEMGRSPVSIDPEAMQLLQAYDWPGNVRELKNVLEGALMLLSAKSTKLGVRDLPQEVLIPEGNQAELSERDIREREHLISTLKRTNGNRTKAAEILGYHRNTITQKMRFFGIRLEG
jgi:two-component system, NtrC family, response regulator AtoC